MPDLKVTGLRGNPTRVVLSDGREATITQKLIDTFASPSPFDHASENMFGKQRGRFDEGVALDAQRSIEQTLISSFFALPPERIATAVADFNEAHKPRCGQSGWMIVPTGAGAPATVDPAPSDLSRGSE